MSSQADSFGTKVRGFFLGRAAESKDERRLVRKLGMRDAVRRRLHLFIEMLTLQLLRFLHFGMQAPCYDPTPRTEYGDGFEEETYTDSRSRLIAV